MNNPQVPLELYWNHKAIPLPIDPSRCLYWQKAPTALPILTERLRDVLDKPGKEPPLEQCVVPGDIVALAIDPQTPGLTEIMPVILSRIIIAGVEPQDITIVISLQGKYQQQTPTLKEALIELLMAEYPLLTIIEHAPVPETNLRYLASTALAQPVMLNHTLVDADVVITLGISCYDRYYGERGTTSVLYPGFSTPNDLIKGTRQGHVELTSGEVFPLKQMADEVGWLLGSVVTLQVIPASFNQPHEILWGTNDTVSRQALQKLSQSWKIPLTQRVETVIAIIPHVSTDIQTEILIECMARARQLVKRGGRMFLLSEQQYIDIQLTSIIAGNIKPSEIYQNWPKDSLNEPWKLLTRNFLETIEWCHVYLHSLIDPKLAEQNMLIPFTINDEEWLEVVINSQDFVILENPLYISTLSHLS